LIVKYLNLINHDKQKFIVFAAMISCNHKRSINNSNKSVIAKSELTQTLYYGSDIITMEGDKPEYAEAVVQQDGEIVFVGLKAEAEKEYTNAQKYDLKGQTIK